MQIFYYYFNMFLFCSTQIIMFRKTLKNNLFLKTDTYTYSLPAIFPTSIIHITQTFTTKWCPLHNFHSMMFSYTGRILKVDKQNTEVVENERKKCISNRTWQLVLKLRDLKLEINSILGTRYEELPRFTNMKKHRETVRFEDLKF